MRRVGKQIAHLRKEMKMTQMELAEQMGVSFQAVSNWERGETMPDISKLPDLSRIFQVEIDEILTNGKGTQLVKGVIENMDDTFIEELENPKEEFMNAAPVLKMEQADSIFNQLKAEITIDELSILAPFISQDYIDEWAAKEFGENGISSLAAIAPFLGQEKIDEFAVKDFEQKGIAELSSIAPFVSQNTLDECARSSFEKEGISSIVAICPFIEGELLNELALEAIAAKGIQEIAPILPFLDSRDFKVVTK
ncbi:DNA-binding XRE family transcriptional regulator [Falsibacillus pallidus]|uniref:DNA-binding XRE family transcriptional regulator n=2 Tax=Falsibacillus pallidus TaxID=493781 RepID=A0A370GAW9_9BACI|nr:DNA-binding XRE family transcriptional regulator [Falsibacillus pallidus]